MLVGEDQKLGEISLMGFLSMFSNCKDSNESNILISSIWFSEIFKSLSKGNFFKFLIVNKLFPDKSKLIKEIRLSKPLISFILFFARLKYCKDRYCLNIGIFDILFSEISNLSINAGNLTLEISSISFLAIFSVLKFLNAATT